jgi:hypothetical protein
VVPQVQTPSRCCRFLLSLGNRLLKKILAQRDFYLQPVFVADVHVSASDGGCATPKPN